ncbi:uncharacterized protein JCM10292_003798 [Rhodotorula paludigena]|uniref:uncharacterized protein n=1 Tax=Rhodotorula paludigena TaxID=86838 RepID=UPI00317B998A
MPKIYKPGKVALVLSGRYAGRKVVVIRQSDEGTKERPYPHAIVAGVDRYPRKVTKGMGKKRIEKRSKVKPFIKSINYNHLLPTRYALELESLKGVVAPETFKEVSSREDSKKQVKKIFEERYLSGKNRWFFSPLRF